MTTFWRVELQKFHPPKERENTREKVKVLPDGHNKVAEPENLPLVHSTMPAGWHTMTKYT